MALEFVDWRDKIYAPKFDSGAHLSKTDDFRARYEYGKAAEDAVLAALVARGAVLLSSDFREFQEHMPQVPNPRPDFEFENCFVEVRKTQTMHWYNNQFPLGYGKKVPSWLKCADDAGKHLFFVVVTEDGKMSMVDLSANRADMQTRPNPKNPAAILDYTLDCNLFATYAFDDGIDVLVKECKHA